MSAAAGVLPLYLRRAAEAAGVWRQGMAILRSAHDDQGAERETRSMRTACAEAGVAPFDEPVA